MHTVTLLYKNTRIASFTGDPRDSMSSTHFYVLIYIGTIELLQAKLLGIPDLFGNTILVSQPTHTSWDRLLSVLYSLSDEWDVAIKDDEHPIQGKLDIPKNAVP
jgi:hypothetical protein